MTSWELFYRQLVKASDDETTTSLLVGADKSATVKDARTYNPHNPLHAWRIQFMDSWSLILLGANIIGSLYSVMLGVGRRAQSNGASFDSTTTDESNGNDGDIATKLSQKQSLSISLSYSCDVATIRFQ
ncbi:hypothetical protein MPSEU_000552700 [Mayamaea pseudoterrestris]|nr:hypothetical protein MPSEU_000552700 [Mayamaea pseudoterrestris]